MGDLTEKALISVLKGEVPHRRAMWFMRQAGRYLPEYRKVRQEAGSFLDLCYNPMLAAEVTLQPLRRYDIDAAIIFADILVVPHAMGNGLAFVEGEGPVLEKLRGKEDLRRLSDGIGSREFLAIAQSLELVRSKLPKQAALIGFCGAPWTVASYMIEGGSSERQLARQIAYERPEWFVELIDRLVESSIAYLVLQVKAGAEVVQIFDSWGGDLAGDLFDDFCIEPIRRVVEGFRLSCPDIPVIVFAKGAGRRHAQVFAATGCQAVGVEAEQNLAELAAEMPEKAVLQGNLDPVVLLCADEVIENYTDKLARSMPLERHIFNLGHGIKQQTRPEALSLVVDKVREIDNV